MTETTAFNLPKGLQGKVSVKIAPAQNKSVFRCINDNNAGVVYIVSGESLERKTVDLIVYNESLDVNKDATLNTYERRRLASIEMDVNKLSDLRHPSNPNALDVKAAIRRLNSELNRSSYVETTGGVKLDVNSARVTLKKALPNLSTNYWLDSGSRFFEVDYEGINFGKYKDKREAPLCISISAPFFNKLKEEFSVNVTVGYHDQKLSLAAQKKMGKLSFPAIQYVATKSVAKGNWNGSDDRQVRQFVKRVVKDVAEFRAFEGWFPRKRLARSINYHSGRKANAEFIYPEGNTRLIIPTAFVVETLNDSGCLKVTDRPNLGYGKSMTHKIESNDGTESVKLSFIPLEDCLNADIAFDGYVDDYISWNRKNEFKRGAPTSRLETLVSQFFHSGILTFNSQIKNVADAVAFVESQAEVKGLDKVKYKNSGSLKAIARVAPPAYGDQSSLTMERLFEKRGLSKESLDYCLKNNLVQMARHPDDFRGGSENIPVGNNTDLSNPRKIIAQQFFSEQSNGKIFKAWASNANSSKASFNVGDSWDAEDLIMTEATFDAIALRDLFMRCDIPVEDKMISSVNSTAYLAGFFEQNFGLQLPVDKDSDRGVVGYLLEDSPIEFIKDESEISERRDSVIKGLAAYESVIYVDSGSEASTARLERLSNLLNGSLPVVVDRNEGRYLTGNYDFMRKGIKHIVLDETNIDDVMNGVGVKFSYDNKPMFFESKKPERKAIFTRDTINLMPSGKQEAYDTLTEARKRIRSVMPNLQRAYYGFDNDAPGLSSAHSFCHLMKELGFGGHLMAPPLFSRISVDVNLSDIQDAYEGVSLNDESQVKSLIANEELSPFNITNDWNELAKLNDSFTNKLKNYFSAGLCGMLDDDTMFESFVGTAKMVDATRKVASNIEEEEKELKMNNAKKNGRKRSFR